MASTGGTAVDGAKTEPTALAKRTPTPADSRLHNSILDLFFARTDVFPYQWFSAHKQIGGYAKTCSAQPPWTNVRCLRKRDGVKCGGCDTFAPVPVDEKIVDMHLKGAITIGSYQLALDGSTVKWMCLDFDDHGEGDPEELKVAAQAARYELAGLGMPTYIEASGGAGWRCHLWTFFSGPVPAIKARVILNHVLQATGLDDKPYIERFPKQSRALNGYGNLVKLPFGIHRKTGKRSCFLDPETLEPIPLAQALAGIETVDPVVVDATIDLKHLSIEDSQGLQAAPAKNFNYPVEEMHKLLRRCWYFQEVERRQLSADHQVHYEDWWHYVLTLCRFGDAGVSRILAFSRLDERYDEDYTVSTINYVREHGYHMPSCRRLRTGPGQVHCLMDPMECGAQ